MSDISQPLAQQVIDAAESKTPLSIIGSGSKAFLGNPVNATPLDVTSHTGVVNYEPTELVITARAGTPLAEIEQLLADNQQMLSPEMPDFNGKSTIGGCVAAGLGGPRRPWGGAPRDVLLGTRLLDGQGQIMSFGGQVMKNVAGYDVSRLQAGALGTLGVLLDVSLKVLPAHTASTTLVFELSREQALTKMRELARKPAPISGACHLDGQMYLRLEGNQANVDDWTTRLGGEDKQLHQTFWQNLRNHKLDYFQSQRTLWRLSLPPATPQLPCEQHALLDWAGGQRWVYSSESAEHIREQVARHKGHAEVFRRGDDCTAPWQSLAPPLQTLHVRLKQKFDPHNILNPGRLLSGE